MNILLNINDVEQEVTAQAGDTLLKTLRHLGYFGVKHGCENGECGACAILLDGKPVASCVMLAAAAHGKQITTIEALGQVEDQGWKHTEGLHPIQKAFVELGALQCGYCTPAMILAAKALLDRTLTPSEEEVRDALSGVLCRCTGYVKPVQAVLLAAERIRSGGSLGQGEQAIPIALPPRMEGFPPPEFPGAEPPTLLTATLPKMVV